MMTQEQIQHGYFVSVRPLPGTADTFVLSYLPRGLQQARESGSTPQPVSEFRAHAQVQGQAVAVTWPTPPPQNGAGHAEYNADVTHRVKLLAAWLQRLNDLLTTIRSWAEESGWAARLVDKGMKDPEIGDYRAPALLLQEGLLRIAVEPIGRTGPGTEGIVDLYLLPAYDDIATLSHYDGTWHIHYQSYATPTVATIRETTAKPFSKEHLLGVFGEMRQHAA